MQHPPFAAPRGEGAPLDALYILLVVAFFGAAIAYVSACDHL